ncbi:discoidin domain-containing protein [Dokdonella sp.]|uniref:discoidin domain-containing protein n=1 Tax=Dokdonella sp. TaxID=2291710 RepID=UPI0025BF8FB7|nr:discoidin domain-containing protein [Dokdonella sp.]MBX3689982.1 discoidin domain-containing protein [Dokdonella sp.]
MSLALPLRTIVVASLLLATPLLPAQSFFNAALNKPVTAHFDTVAGAPENVVDGDNTSAWWTYQGQFSELGFTVDLDGVFRIDQLVIRPLQTEHIEIFASMDAAEWTLLHQATVGYYTAPVISHDLPEPVMARYLRLRSDNSQAGYVGLLEMEANGLDAIFGDDFEAVDVRSDT